MSLNGFYRLRSDQTRRAATTQKAWAGDVTGHGEANESDLMACHRLRMPSVRGLRITLYPNQHLLERVNMKPNGHTHAQNVQPQSVNTSQPDSTAPAFRYEVIDSATLAKRWNVPRTWIQEGTRTRTQDKIPCVRFGRYTRFLWGDPELAAWFERRRNTVGCT